jgi:hypothetical protein
MADFATCRQDLLLNLRARIPFICVKTDEPARGLELFHEVSKDLNAPIYYRSPSQGMRDVASLIDQRENLTFVLTEVPHLETNSRTTRQILALVTSAIDHGGVICVITPDSIWSRLQQLGILLSLDSPNQDEMTTIIGEFIDQYRGNIDVEWGPEETKQAGLILGGFTRLEAENRLLRLVANGSVRRSDLDALAQTKDRMLAEIAGLERVPVSAGDLCVGGLAGLNDWLRTREPLLGMDLRERGLRQPRGVLVVGVPGCGKSLSARHIAATWSLALYRLDLTNIHRAYLDHPEQGLKEALATVDRLAPCVLWIDEIETGLAGGGDVRTAARLVGQFSYWLQEAAARVFVVSTANDVARLPAELVRKGHFDEVFFVDLPSEGERREIITLYVAHYLGVPPADELLEDLVSASAGFACSDLAAACAEVAHMALLNGIASVEDQRWKDIFANTTPLSRTNPEQIAQLRSWGRQLAVPASGRPIGGGDPTESHGRIVIA